MKLYSEFWNFSNGEDRHSHCSHGVCNQRPVGHARRWVLRRTKGTHKLAIHWVEDICSAEGGVGGPLCLVSVSRSAVLCVWSPGDLQLFPEGGSGPAAAVHLLALQDPVEVLPEAGPTARPLGWGWLLAPFMRIRGDEGVRGRTRELGELSVMSAHILSWPRSTGST